MSYGPGDKSIIGQFGQQNTQPGMGGLFGREASSALSLDQRVLIALGGLRDDMPPEDVRAVQRFAQLLRFNQSA